MAFIYINGNFFEDVSAKISVKDRSFRFGDGVFETISFDNGKISHWNLHKKRLEDGLAAIKIEFNAENLENNILKTIERNKLSSGSARINITRGEGSRGYLPTYQKPCNVGIEVMDKLIMEKTSANLCVSSYRKIPLECLPVNFKLSQGLNSSLAKMEAREKGFFEALQLNIKNEIAECSSGNIFWTKGDKIYTPSLECDVLNGVIRQVILQKSSYKIIEGKFELEHLKDADEIFITNTIWKVLAVDSIENIWKSSGKNKISQELFRLVDTH